MYKNFRNLGQIVQVKAKEFDCRAFKTFSNSLVVLSAKEISGLSGKEFLDKFQFNSPVGSGEYIVLAKDITKQQNYTLTRRDDYWAKDYPISKYSGNFDKISFFFQDSEDHSKILLILNFFFMIAVQI